MGHQDTITRTKDYQPIVIGGTVYVALHRQAREDHDLPADADELPETIPVEYHMGPNGTGKQVIDFEKVVGDAE